VIPVGPIDDRPDYELTDNLTFRAFDIVDGVPAMREVPMLNGEPGVQLVLRRNGGEFEAEISGAAVTSWRVQLIGVTMAGNVSGGTLVPDPRGVILASTKGARTMRLTLRAASGAA
jgi:alpha-D-xyloside xylohydrolase